MPYTKEHILVFLAYISDVEPEVNAAMEIVESINRAHERLGIECDLRTWKDVPGEFGNPQQQINREFVGKCDVFIGVIYKKWGTPTGQSDCGFKEEFDIAERRYNDTGKPTILLYAKTVNELDVKDDEKEGFNKVKKFTDEIITKHKGFLIQFASIEKWKEIIRERLTQYVVDKYVSTPALTSEPQKSLAVSVADQYKVVEKIKTPKEVQPLIDDLIAYRNNIDKIRDIEDFKKVRLFLLSSAVFYSSFFYEILGNHEIHLFYLHRLNIKLTGSEAKLILRTIIADRSSHKTGWYWFTKIQHKQLKYFVSNHLVADSDKDVRYGALSFLDRFWIKQFKRQVLQAINDSEDDIKIKALQICSMRGDEGYLKAIEECFSDPNKDVVNEALTAKFAILSRSNPDEAIKFLQQFKENIGGYFPFLKQIKNKLSLEMLRELIKDPDELIKKIAYEQLLASGRLSTEELRELVHSESPILRKFAYLALIEQGEKFSVAAVQQNWPLELGLLGLHSYQQRDIVIGKIYEASPKEELLNEVDWFSTTGHLAYLSLGLKHFDTFKDQIYEDLSLDFLRIKQRYVEKRKSELIEAIKKKTTQSVSEEKAMAMDEMIGQVIDSQIKEELEKSTKVNEYIKDRFIVAALNVLASKGSSESLKYAIKYAASNDKEIQGLVVRIIAKYGDSTDVTFLTRIAIDNYGQTKNEAVKQSLKLSNFDKAVVQKFLLSEKKEIIQACLAYDLVAKSPVMIEDAKGLLMQKSENIRICALSYLANILSSAQLHKLLYSYLSGPTYYYNVVCWIDRILFAPSKIKNVYRTELLNEMRKAD